MESLIPLLIEDLKLIGDEMPEGFETIFVERERVSSRLSDLLATNQEFYEAAWSNAAVGAKAPISIGNTYIDFEELISNLSKQRDLRQFGSEKDLFLDIRPIEPLKGNFEKGISILEAALNENKKIIFSASSKGMIDRYASIFRDADLPVQIQLPLNAEIGRAHV